MKQVTVIHSAFEDTPETVAYVNVPDTFSATMALEYAYQKTNNVSGSWSKPATFEFNGEIYENFDYSEDVTVVATLPKNKNGEELGLRSTSVNDIMMFNGKKFMVDFCGFKEVNV